jgi:hypothetical protein
MPSPPGCSPAPPLPAEAGSADPASGTCAPAPLPGAFLVLVNTMTKVLLSGSVVERLGRLDHVWAVIQARRWSFSASAIGSSVTRPYDGRIDELRQAVGNTVTSAYRTSRATSPAGTAEHERGDPSDGRHALDNSRYALSTPAPTSARPRRRGRGLRWGGVRRRWWRASSAMRPGLDSVRPRSVAVAGVAAQLGRDGLGNDGGPRFLGIGVATATRGRRGLAPVGGVRSAAGSESA